MRKIFSALLKCLAALVLLAFLLAAWTVYDTQRYKAFHNPENVPDLAHFVEYYGSPEKMYLVHIGQKSYYELIAPKGDFKVLVSGPPTFLYDMHGNFRDYTWNVGDVNFVNGNFQSGLITRDKELANPLQVIRKITNARDN